MTAADLVRALENCSPDAEVVVFVPGVESGHWYRDAHSITEVQAGSIGEVWIDLKPMEGSGT